MLIEEKYLFFAKQLLSPQSTSIGQKYLFCLYCREKKCNFLKNQQKLLTVLKTRYILFKTTKAV
jgi:hypothetical protein